MIAFVKGLVTEITEDGMVLDVGDVGIGLLAPLTQLQPAPVIGEPYFLHTHLQVREDAWTLPRGLSYAALFRFSYLAPVPEEDGVVPVEMLKEYVLRGGGL